jgi:hypothetical protein
VQARFTAENVTAENETFAAIAVQMLVIGTF